MGNSRSLLEIQELALNTNDVSELEQLLLESEQATGKESDRFALRLFLKSRINNPDYPTLSSRR
ncbi:MAG: hypothetical protein ACD_5C00092G0003 [uncultured bacterium]|nr:MAG: hypothetical protein ACD_5C00092G0003 [uncultured bacterium]